MTPHVEVTADELRAHADFVRRLASGLVGEASAADDVAQEVMLRAATRPPRDPGAVRAWLGTVTRRLVSRWRREASRRARRELAAARPEALPPADATLAHAETLQRVTEAVLALDGPQREVVLLRYYEGLDVDAIAARTGLSVVAVRSRLRRAQESLRQRLRRALGEDGWRAALAGLGGIGIDSGTAAGTAATAVLAGSSKWAAIGALLMSQKAKWSAVVLLCVLLFGGALLVEEAIRGEPSAPQPPGVVTADGQRAPSVEAVAEGAPAAEERAPVPSPLPAAGPTCRIVGRVFDDRHLAVAGVEIEAEVSGEDPRRTRSGPDGRYSIDLGPRDLVAGWLTARAKGQGYVATFARDTSFGDVLELDVVLRPLHDLEVRVVAAGVPVSAASVIVKPRWVGDSSWRARAETDRNGIAIVSGLVAGEYRIHARADTRGTSSLVEVREGRNTHVVLNLDATLVLEVVCHGAGKPVPGAEVRAIVADAAEGGGYTLAELEAAGRPITDATGRARIAGVQRDMTLWVEARAKGFALARREVKVDERAPRLAIAMEPRIENELRWKIRADGGAPDAGTRLRVRAMSYVQMHQGVDAAGLSARVEGEDVVVRPVPQLEGWIVVADARGVFSRLHVDQSGAARGMARFLPPRTLRVVATAAGRPVAGLPLRIDSREEPRRGGHFWTCRSDAEGRAIFARLYDARYTLVSGNRDIAEADLTQGDAELWIERPKACDVTVHCFVDGARRLPPTYVVDAEPALVGAVAEDPIAGTLRFPLMPADPEKDVELRVYGPRGYHVLVERITPARAAAPLALEWRAVRYVDASLRVLPPSDGIYRLLLERGNTAGQWWIFQHYHSSTPPPGHLHRFSGLPPGLYRARDERSGELGPTVEVRPDMTSAELVLDLSRLVLLRVRVTLPPNRVHRPGPAIELCDGERVVTTLGLAENGGDGSLLLPLLPGVPRTLRVRDDKLEIQGGDRRVDASMGEVSLTLVERR